MTCDQRSKIQKMAEKNWESRPGKDVPLENKDLLLQLVVKRLLGGGDESKAHATCSKILEKRKQKWRKRYKSSQEQGDKFNQVDLITVQLVSNHII